MTQQLARTLFLSNKKTYGRKVREAALAMMIDAQLTQGCRCSSCTSTAST